MADFPLTHFTIGEKNPDSSTKVQFGKGYTFGSEPKGPDQIIFILKVRAMFFYESAPGVLDITTDPGINMGKLIAFYEEHKTFHPFTFNHPWRGEVTVKFEQPLEWQLAENGKGATEPFEIRLELQP